MFKFLTHKPLWVNILAVILLTAILIMLFLGSLDFITKHGKYERVPTILGKTLTEATTILNQKGFEVEIQDSVYIDSVAPSAVVKQTPEAESSVKVNRTIYLTINRSEPPLVEMPNLIGFSIRNAEMYLENLGLRIGDTSFRPDIAKNAVLEQLFKGQPIKAGTKIHMGSEIGFVLGNGVSDAEMPVPNLVGKTYAQAKSYLRGVNLNYIPVADLDVTDTESAFVYRQNPNVYSGEEAGQKIHNRIKPGQTIDLYLSREMPVTDSATLRPEPQASADENQ